MTIMTRRSPQWGEVPALALSRVFDFLDETKDRYNASLVCWHWRSILFQRRFFQKFKFILYIDNDRQCSFFLQTLLNLTSELTMVFDFMCVYHIEKIRRILYKIARSDSLEGIRFQTNNVGHVAPGDIIDEGLVDIEQFFVEPIKIILSRKKSSMKILDMGAIESLTYYGADFLKSIAKPQEIEQLTFASIKFDPSHYPIFVLEPVFLEKCASLQVLSLDYDTLNEDVLRTIQILPLKKLMICVHGLDREHPGISEHAWSEFAKKFQNIDLIVSLVYAYEAVEVLQVRILRQNMPITHLRVLFCDFINVEALEWMSLNNKNTLKSVQWIDSAFKHPDKNVMDLFLRSGQDPFVMMSWRCENLQEIVIHGYVLDAHNIVGISRLRGRSLKRLEISMIDNTPSTASMESFIEEISSLLGQRWKPLNPANLHPSLGYAPVSDDVRDEYVFDLIRSDLQSN